MAATKAASALTWKRQVAQSEGEHIPVGAPAAIAKHDPEEGASGRVDVIGAGTDSYVLMDPEGGGSADLGYDDDEAIVVLASSDFETPKAFVKVPRLLAKTPEYLVGEISLTGKLTIGDFTLPRKPGRYTVVEGYYEGDDGSFCWARITPAGRKRYDKRPVEAPKDEVAREMERISFATPKDEARALESALALIELGRPDLAVDICAKASPARRVLASWTRILALAAQKDVAAARDATALAEEWLRPADSTEHASQSLPRAHVLRMLDAVGAAELRVRVAAAPEREVFVPDGDFF